MGQISASCCVRPFPTARCSVGTPVLRLDTPGPALPNQDLCHLIDLVGGVSFRVLSPRNILSWLCQPPAFASPSRLQPPTPLTAVVLAFWGGVQRGARGCHPISHR